MYTQSFSVPDDEGGKAAGLKAVAKPLSEAEQALQAQFDARIDADGHAGAVRQLPRLARPERALVS